MDFETTIASYSDLPEHASDGFGSRTLEGRKAVDSSRDTASHAEVNPLHVLHRSLRGHYLWAVPIAILLAVLGGAVGWRLTRPQYRSEGLIEIKYAQPAVDPTAAQTGPTPFEVYVESQRTLITSRRVVDKALEEPCWTSLHRPLTPGVVREFITNLDVKFTKGTEYLKITYTDGDPLVAAAAVKAVTNAYVAVYKENDQNLESTRLRLLKQTKRDLEDRIERMQAETDQTVKRFGSADLAILQSAAVMRTTRLDSAIDDIRLVLASRPLEAAAMPPVVPASQPAVEASVKQMTPQQIAQSDAVMRGYLDDQRKLEDELQIVQAQGYGESHPTVLQLKFRLERVADRMRQYAQEFAAVQQATGRTMIGMTGDPAVLAMKSPGQLRAEEGRLIALRDSARAEMADLATEQVRQTRRDADLLRDRQALELITKKIDQLDDLEQMGGRLTVISAGEIPLSPEPDRRLKFAGAGALFGGVSPIAILTLLGLLRQQYKYSDETVEDLSSSAPLLGILPTLGEQSDHESAMLAAQRVHQIRVMLQAGRQGQHCVSYLVTSTSAGEGKTSLAMSLGLSFAATGVRTLLIDADLVGQHLTHGMDARDLPGLHEALREGSLRGCLRRTLGGLCVLPVGGADAQDACAVSPTALRGLMQEARRYFDIILFDSGPILGSVEVSLLAQDVDGVLLTVSHGQQPPLVQRALQHLNALGATVCGFVFNRARTGDFYSSYYGSSSRSRSGSELRSLPAPVQRRCRLGPLVAAVASSLPTGMQSSLS